PFDVRVIAKDAAGNNAENFGAGNALTLTGLQAAVLANGQVAFDAPVVPAFANGVATFTGLAISNAADGYTFSAQATSSGNVVTDAVDAPFNITFKTLTVGAVANVRAGAPFNVTV